MKNNEDIRQAFLRKMKYPVALEFSEENHRNPSKYRIEEHDYLNWMKQQRKLLNAGALKEDRVERFKELMELCDKYRRKNQYM